MKKIEFYETKKGKEPVKDWILSLDKSIRIKIIKRIERIYDDNFGDYKKIATDLFELRFVFGKGYRIYYTIKQGIIVLLLNAGDKSRQQKDIKAAKEYLQEYDNRNLQKGDKNV